ncbi:MAG: hypothetical protein ABSH36_11815 [Solirubrobacteraceae bacterium]
MSSNDLGAREDAKLGAPHAIRDTNSWRLPALERFGALLREVERARCPEPAEPASDGRGAWVPEG